MTYYKTGEFAKMASLSIRTIRYYDEIGLLKPTLVQENGYRVYSDNDFLKLQKIIALKSLGFSLEDIFTMTVNDDYISLKDTLLLQEKMIDTKIRSLQVQKKSLQNTINSIENSKDVSWMDIFHDIQFNSMENELVEQYKNANNVDIRVRLHQKYSTNPIHWFNWLYSLYRIKDDDEVLEIGCGNGELWARNPNTHRHITLSDVSSGMLEDANKRLGNQYHYVTCDAQKLPFEDESFDIVIANHVLFYINDLDQAIKEIYRVLKPGGKLFASSYGPTHMKEITSLVKEFNPRINLSNINLYDQFGLHNGQQILSKKFDKIELVHYDDHLFVTDYNDLIYYMLSCHGNQSEYLSKDYDRFMKFMKKKVGDGIKITKDAGVFICEKEK